MSQKVKQGPQSTKYKVVNGQHVRHASNSKNFASQVTHILSPRLKVKESTPLSPKGMGAKQRTSRRDRMKKPESPRPIIQRLPDTKSSQQIKVVQDYKFLSKKMKIVGDEKITTILSSRGAEGDNNDDLEVDLDDSLNERVIGDSIKNRNSFTEKKQKFPLTARLAAKTVLSPRNQKPLKSNRRSDPKSQSDLSRPESKNKLVKIQQKTNDVLMNHLRQTQSSTLKQRNSDNKINSRPQSNLHYRDTQQLSYNSNLQNNNQDFNYNQNQKLEPKKMFMHSNKKTNFSNSLIKKSNMSLERTELTSKYGQKKLSEMKSQSKERQTVLESHGRKAGRTGANESSIGKSPVGKMTKNTYLSGYKGAGAAAQKLAHKLNMSLNSVQSQEDKPESRALVSSPFKKPILQQKRENQSTLAVDKGGSKYTKINKQPRLSNVSSSKQKYDYTKSVQRGSYQNLLIKGVIYNRQPSTSISREVAYDQMVNQAFNSKSPSKKSVQLQQILKSINTPNKQDTIGRHGHTKSYKAIAGSTLQTTATQNKSQVGLNIVNRTSSVNPYIQNITKANRNKDSLSNSAVIQENVDKQNDVMQQLMEDFDAKNKQIATERNVKAVIQSPKSLKQKKLSVNYPDSQKKYQGLIKKHQKAATIQSPATTTTKNFLFTERATKDEPLSSHRRKKNERAPVAKPFIPSVKKAALIDGPKEVSFVKEELEFDSNIDQSENIENYNSSPTGIQKKKMDAPATKILTTNFQKKEGNIKYMAISFENQTPVKNPYKDDEEEIERQSHLGLSSKSQSQSQSQSMSQIQSSQPQTPSELPEDKFPRMTCEDFLHQYRSVMLKEEIAELGRETDKFSMIYYAGSIPERTPEDLVYLREINKERIETFNQKKSELEDPGNGEFQGNPIFDNFEGYFKVQIGEHIAYRYEIMKVLGKGSFAQVVQCMDHMDPKKPIYAVKITRNTEMDHKFAHKEAQYLKYIMQEDPLDNHNIVRMVDQTYFREHHCFVFELLHTDLFEHLKATGFVGFSTDKIRDYAVQIIKGLVFLEKHKIIHCDLKPENILCADTMCRNLKIVDFGSGCFRDEQIYTYVQSRFYRSPEVILRIKYTEKVDIWSLGCILAELYTGEPLFPGNNEQEQIELIMELCGMPPESMIDKSRKKEHYFDTDYSPFLIEDDELGILRIPSSRLLKEAVPCEDADFLDFIVKCLEIDPETRFSASEAMEHPWIKAALHQSFKNHHRMSEKAKPAKRMGQNESAEHLYQPQIIREREGVEIPAEFSPERDLIISRKKSTAQKPNSESFGIKLNNLNLGSTEKKKEQRNHNIKVTDFIAASAHKDFNSNRESAIARDQELSDLTSLKNSNESNVKNQYYTIYKQPSDLNVSNSSIVHKSIIPEIDFTNKYVRRVNNYQSRNDMSQHGDSSNNVETMHSPFRNKVSHLSQMEQISQFENQEEEAAAYQHVNNSSLAITSGASLVGTSTFQNHRNSNNISNSPFKKKALNNNFIQPSQ